MMIRTRSVVIASLAVLSLALIMLGMIALLSSSSFLLSKSGTDVNIYRLLGRQLMWFAVGLAGMSVVCRMDHTRLQSWAWPILLFASFLLLLSVAGPLARDIKGATRSILLGPVRIQPSEFAKVFVIIFLADFWSRKQPDQDGFLRAILPLFLVAVFILAPIFKQPDNGTGILIGVVALTMWFVAGARIKHVIAISGVFVSTAVLLIVTSSHAQRRVLAWLNPEAHSGGSSYQVNNALIALARGGWAGVGLGEGTQTLGFTPEVHTDFIFSVIGEDLGFIAGMFLIVAFALIAGLAMLVAWKSGDRFGALLAFGCGLTIDLQALLNLLVVTNSLPTTGFSLPLISYGGSSLIVSMVLIGLVARVAQVSLLPDGPFRQWASSRSEGSERRPARRRTAKSRA